jgi:hypothetical protein
MAKAEGTGGADFTEGKEGNKGEAFSTANERESTRISAAGSDVSAPLFVSAALGFSFGFVLPESGGGQLHPRLKALGAGSTTRRSCETAKRLSRGASVTVAGS